MNTIKSVDYELQKIEKQIRILKSKRDIKLEAIVMAHAKFNKGGLVPKMTQKICQLEEKVVEVKGLRERMQYIAVLQNLKDRRDDIKEKLDFDSKNLGELKNELSERRQGVSDEEMRIAEIYGLIAIRDLQPLLNAIREAEARITHNLSELKSITQKIRELTGELEG